MSSTDTTEGLVSQSEARAEARRWNEDNLVPELVCVAVPYPYNSWGGEERGWTTVIAVVNR